MTHVKSKISIGSLSMLGLLMLVGCGTKDHEAAKKDEKVSASTVVSDSQLSSSLVNASHSDVVSAISDQASGSASLMLEKQSTEGTDSDVDKSTVTKTCAVDGATAVVDIKTEINRAQTTYAKSGTVKHQRSRTGSGTVKRIWSRTDGTAVACGSEGHSAIVDFQNPNGLKLDVTFDRSRVESKTVTGPKLTRSSSRSFTAKGKRSSTWSSNDATEDSSTTFIRNKTVVLTDVTHDIAMTDKDGTQVKVALAIKTEESKPLVVKVERNKSDYEVVSKTIVSGELISAKDADAVISTTYENLKMSYDSKKCKLVGGKATMVFKDSLGEVLLTLVLSIDSDGDAELKDDKGVAVEGFTLDDCDSEDLKI